MVYFKACLFGKNFSTVMTSYVCIVFLDFLNSNGPRKIHFQVCQSKINCLRNRLSIQCLEGQLFCVLTCFQVTGQISHLHLGRCLSNSIQCEILHYWRFRYTSSSHSFTILILAEWFSWCSFCNCKCLRHTWDVQKLTVFNSTQLY